MAIHLDVDVVDSNEAVFGLGAEPNGLTSTQVHRVITDIQGAAEVVGLTIAEYVPRQAMAVQRLLKRLTPDMTRSQRNRQAALSTLD